MKNNKNGIFILICALFLTTIYGEDIHPLPQEWFEKHLKSESISEKIVFLSNAISHKHAKKWNGIPGALFLRGNYFLNDGFPEKALNDFLLLTKKHKYYYEPWIESIFLALYQKDFSLSHALSKKALKKCKNSLIPFLPPGNVTFSDSLKNEYELLLLSLKAVSGIFLNKKRSLQRDLYVFKSFYFKDTVIIHSTFPLFIQGIIFYWSGDIYQARQLFTESLKNNWDAESHPIFLFVLEYHESFRDYYLELKEEYSTLQWNKPWSMERKKWQLKKWKEDYNEKCHSIILRQLLI